MKDSTVGELRRLLGDALLRQHHASQPGSELARHAFAWIAQELEKILNRAEDPPCTRCGQKINGPAPRGICGDCTAEDPEQADDPPFTPLPPGFFRRLGNQLRRESDGSIPGICESPLDGIGEPEAIAEATEQAARERMLDDGEARLLQLCVAWANDAGRISDEERRRAYMAINRVDLAEGKEPT